MNAPMDRPRDSGFGLGVLIGACAGASLALWLAPRMGAGNRERVGTDRLRRRASKRYRQARLLVREAVDEITRKGQSARDGVAAAVAHGAQAVERVATAAKA